MSLESKNATCVGSLCERAKSHGTRDFAGDADLQAPFRNVERLSITFTSNGKRQFVPPDQVSRQQHTLHLNAIGFKAQSLWDRVKVITNEYRTIIKIGITYLQNTTTTKTLKIYSKILKRYNVKMNLH